MIQADIGSQPQSRRSWQWINRLREACKSIGAQGTTLYEYMLGMYMYTEPPRVVKTMRAGRNSVLLVFNKRLDAQSAGEKSRYTFTPAVEINQVEVDGNLVRLYTAPTHARRRYRLRIHGVSDDPSARWLPDTPALTLPEQTVTV